MSSIKSQIEDRLSHGECVQIVSLPGMGASRLQVSLNGFVLNHHLISSNPTPETLIKIVSDNMPQNLIIIDRLNELLRPQYTPFFYYLKQLRDQNKYHLKYMFFYRSVLPVEPSKAPILAELYPLVSENIIYLTPIPEMEFHNTIIQEFSPNLGFIPTPLQIDNLWQLSGGIRSLIKIIMQAQRNHQDSDLHNNLRLNTQLEEIKLALGENPSYEVLKSHQLINSDGNIQSSLLKNYLAQTKSPLFSTSEKLLFDLLKNHLNEVVSKDNICAVVYPEVKNREGISDHSIDQLIHRLREKISPQYTLTTRRGFGYILQRN